jgi:hypothetical protein
MKATIRARFHAVVSRFRCCGCGRIGWHKNRRLNTAYVNDAQNWVRSCQDCYDEMWEHYAHLWSELYYG